MNTKHLSEEVLQLYVMDPLQCDAGVSEHLKFCRNCKADLEAYQYLFKNIAEQDAPAFESNFSEQVLSSLPATQPRLIFKNAEIILITIIAIIFMSTVIYLFRDYALELFMPARPIILYVTVTSVLCLLGFLCMDMYQQYQQKLKSLDFF
jgi:hypothetical protein